MTRRIGCKNAISYRHLLKAGSLLDMYYKPSELAEHMGVSLQTVYRNYIESGAPCRRDDSNRILISGRQFENWMRKKFEELKQAKLNNRTPTGKMLCVRCHQYVIPENPIVKEVGQANMLVGTCPICGTQTNRFIDFDNKRSRKKAAALIKQP